mmetsp:Transcript_9371/g.29940  ORF Transcript_9371/g.29940 Transcript_9371/m.29940 type:complete len:666 (-) Transcript_9371:83-2080(-)
MLPGNQRVGMEVQASADKQGAATRPLEDVEAGVTTKQQQGQQGMQQQQHSQVGATCNPRDLSWHDLSLTVNVRQKREPGAKRTSKKTILHSTSGAVRAGQLLAIMGPSGSGKTSLLDSLAGRVRSSKLGGEVLINGKSLPLSQRRKALSYVAQEESLMGHFTVYETLCFAARFHFGYRLSRDEFKAVIQEAMTNMGLAHVRDTIVGDIFKKGLSGGQKRRLSIAVELISRPSIVLLDEPTSGLDSASAFSVMKHLTQLAATGHTIVTTIHQPSSQIWALFDRFLLLSQGHTLYFGEGSEAVQYFSSIGLACPQFSNPADYLLAAVNTDFVDKEDPVDVEDLAQRFKASEQGKEALQLASAAKAAGDGVQLSASDLVVNEHSNSALTDFLILSKRNLLNNLRNPGIYWVRFVMYVGLCLVIGVMFVGLGDEFTQSSINSRLSVLFYVAAFLVFMSVAAMPFFIQERAVFVRERTNGMYNPTTFVVSNFVCLLPGIFVIALCSSASVVGISGMNGFPIFLADLFVTLVAAESFVNFVSACVPHYIIGIAGAAGCFGLWMLTEGFFIIRTDMPWYLRWLYYFSFHAPSIRVFIINEFQDIPAKFETPCPAAPGQEAPKQSGRDVIEFYDYTQDDIDRLGVDLVTILCFAFFFQTLYGLVLWRFHRGKR